MLIGFHFFERYFINSVNVLHIALQVASSFLALIGLTLIRSQDLAFLCQELSISSDIICMQTHQILRFREQFFFDLSLCLIDLRRRILVSFWRLQNLCFVLTSESVLRSFKLGRRFRLSEMRDLLRLYFSRSVYLSSLLQNLIGCIQIVKVFRVNHKFIINYVLFAFFFFDKHVIIIILT